ncbi:MAG TPA: HD domain-containing phosphohydrolase [Nitrospiraceae bacterium]|nr:HD domain-containing phosphohydrolase [Nitrospiraceae bacterium]
MSRPSAPPPDPNPSTPLLSLNSEDLRLGMYIHLNCSWFRHPFSRQQFQLTSESQIATIRGLGLPSILVDPAQSTPDSLSHVSHVQLGFAGSPQSAQRTQDPVAQAKGRPVPNTSSASSGASRVGQSRTGFRLGLRQTAQIYDKTARHLKQAVNDLRTDPEEGLAAAKAVTNQLAHVLMDDQLAGTIVGLLDSSKAEERDIVHALNVSVLAMMIGQHLELSLEDLKILGIGALLHDIGIHQLPDRVQGRHERLPSNEAGSYREHPSLGAALLKDLPSFPHEALQIIESHHERIDGSGYPYRLKEEYLSFFTKIVMVADEYDILINHENQRLKMTPAEALSHLYRTARGPLSPDVIDALVQTLTVYPPGTIVELLNGAFALVLNINREARMKPLVLLYTSQDKAGAPVIVDLMRDRWRAIARRPPLSELPARVRDYLDMQRWTTYFLEETTDTGLSPQAV